MYRKYPKNTVLVARPYSISRIAYSDVCQMAWLGLLIREFSALIETLTYRNINKTILIDNGSSYVVDT